MRIFKNVGSIIIHFSIFFIITSIIYVFLFLTQESYLVILSNALMHFFVVALVASIATMAFLAATYKMAGGIQLVFSVIIFSSMMFVFYTAALYFSNNTLISNIFLNKSIDDDNLIDYTDSPSIEEGKFNIFNEYIVYAKDNIGENLYSTIVISKNDSERVLYKADNGFISSNVFELNNVEVFNFIDMQPRIMETAILTDFEEPSDITYIEKISPKGMVFYIVSLILNVFMSSENTPYSMATTFVSLFLLLLGSYSIVYSLSSPIHLLYNLLIVIVLYTLLELKLTVLVNIFSLDNIIKSLNFNLLSISLISIGILLNIFAVIFGQVFKFQKYYKD